MHRERNVASQYFSILFRYGFLIRARTGIGLGSSDFISLRRRKKLKASVIIIIIVYMPAPLCILDTNNMRDK